MGILYAMHRFYGTQFYLRRVFSIIKLLWLFNWELFLSSYSVLRQITTPKLNITPGIFTYKTVLKGDWEITALALLLTLTPALSSWKCLKRAMFLYSCHGHRTV